jgi:hypothetical protein
MAPEFNERDLKDRLLNLERLLLEKQQFFKLILSAAGLILIVFVLGVLAGALGTFSIGTAACADANKCCEKIEPVSKFVQENKISIESRIGAVETKLDSIDKKLTDLSSRKK